MKILSISLILLFVSFNLSAQDLIITNISLRDTTIAFQQSFEVKTTVFNKGNVKAAASRASFYFSKDILLSADDILLGETSASSLAPNQTDTLSIKLGLPGEFAEGYYYILAKADSKGEIGELNENNNIFSIRIKGLLPTFDLSIKSIIPNGTRHSTGEFSGSIVLANDGTAFASNFSVAYYLSIDNNLGSEDIFLNSNGIELITGKSEVTEYFTFNLYDGLTSQQYYLIAVADFYNSFAETIETNNTSMVSFLIEPPETDITIQSFISPVKSVPSANEVNFSTTLYNGGTTIFNSFVVSYFVSKDTVADAQDVFLTSHYVDKVNGGETHLINTDLFVPNVEAGSYYILAVADGYHKIQEVSETNNLSYFKISVTPLHVDISVTDLRINPQNITFNSYCDIQGNEINTGISYALYHEIRFFLSRDPSYDKEDLFLTSTGDFMLAPQNNKTINMPFTVPDIYGYGTFYLIAVTDERNDLSETDESNNIRVISISISPPTVDLVLTRISSDTIISSSGSVIYPKLRERNDGSALAQAHFLGFYLSNDSLFDANDKFLGSHYMDELHSGSYYDNGSISVQLPVNGQEGSYYLLVITDYKSVINESDENNNLAYIHLTIRSELIDLSISKQSSIVSKASFWAYIPLQFEETNTGQFAAPAHYIKMYLSKDSLFHPYEIYLGLIEAPSIQPGQVNTFKTMVSVNESFLPDGEYYIMLFTDPLYNIPETNETNNISLVKIYLYKSGSDLSIKTFELNTVNCSPGSQLYANGFENNLGNVYSSSHYVGYYLSEDSLYSPNDTYLTSVNLYRIAPGDSSAINTSITIPSTTPFGTYFLLAVANTTYFGNDLNNTNDVKSIRIRIGEPVAFTDVLLQNLETNVDKGWEKDLLVINFEEYNSGTSITEKHQSEFYISENSLFDNGDVILFSESVPALMPGSYYRTTKKVEIPKMLRKGEFFLIAFADSRKTISETNETNNLVYKKFTVLDSAILGTEPSEVRHNDVRLYPNPVTDKLYFNTNDNSDEAEILNMSGSVILNKRISTTEGNFIDVSSVQAGVYFIKIKRSGVTTLIRKIVIIK